MATSYSSRGTLLLVIFIVILFLPSPTSAFGAGNIPGISSVEGHNWRHGDIEDVLKTLHYLRGHKWTTMLIKRVYFGNWLRDYSQAVDVGSLKGVQAETIRILVWVLSFLSFGYATGEFEVTSERLGCYRPEEHIDNPKDYADNKDARTFDSRLRGPVLPVELAIDPQTGMKNYIANENGNWATSTGYVKFSFTRSIHFGRLYTSGGHGSSGRDEDLCEALRCLGQGLHCMEDFGAHSNYCELALRELGFREVFPHTGPATEMDVRGKRIFPLVTGTFGAVDFLHSVIGEATDHFTQSEVEEMDIALKNASEGATGQRGLGGGGGGMEDFAGLISQIPGMGGSFAAEARDLEAASQAQARQNEMTRAAAPSGGTHYTVPGMSQNFDPVKTASQIYPILVFRDKIVKAISATIAKIPGLEALVEKISEKLTLFVLSLLSPFIRPIIEAVSKSLKDGSSTVVSASADQQFGPWNDVHCTDPTHSMLSKDHFSNELNSCAGRVAATTLQYVVPRILYAWENTGVPVDEVMRDILRAFHHPALRDESIEIQRNMYATVRQWVAEHRNSGNLNNILGSASVKAGKNHKDQTATQGHSHAPTLGGYANLAGVGNMWNKITTRDLNEMQGADSIPRGISPASPTRTPGFGYSGSAWAPPQEGMGDQFLNPANQPGYGGGPGYQNEPPQQMGYQNEPPHMGYQAQPSQDFGPGPGYQTGPPQPPYPGPDYGPPQQQPFGQQYQYGDPQYQQPPYGQPPPFGQPPPQQYPPNPYPPQGYPGNYPGQYGSGGGF